MSNSATVDRPIPHAQAWPLERRVNDLRNCAYLMISSGNVWGKLKPEKVIESRGLADHVSVNRFKQFWKEQQDRFEREQLTKCVNAPIDGGEGK